MSSSGAGRIYVYSAPGYDTPWTRTRGEATISGRGKFKVGYTSRGDASIRVREQTGTAFPQRDDVVLHLDEFAEREDGTTFTDTAVHHALDGAGIHRDSEVVEATLTEIRAAIAAVKRGVHFDAERTETFGMRPEQLEAVEQTAAYFRATQDDLRAPRFLWNAKMRFGKTFTTYQLAKAMGWQRVLVLTYKPAVLNAWRDDLAHHLDFVGWQFADRHHPGESDSANPLVWFASFQDLLGTTAEGEMKSHHEALHGIEWDCIVLDEYHYGAWQGAAKEVSSPISGKRAETPEREAAADADRADEVLDLADAGAPRLLAANPDAGDLADLDASQLRLRGKHYLYLSGTPFRALTDGEFNEDQVFNWTYPQEQTAKRTWDGDPALESTANPYRELPQMQMFTYGLSEMAATVMDAGGESTFNLSAYFEAQKVGSEYHFTDATRIEDFLNMLRGRVTLSATEKLLTSGPRAPFPYSDGRFATAIANSVWFLPTVASCQAMKDALEAHPYFRDFAVHVAAGSTAKGGAEAKGPVDKMLDRARVTGKQTITLSCGKLMTGVTIAQWGAILILRSLKAPESYFQAAFRVQSPWKVTEADGTRRVKKETCYVFDFDPTRALSLIYQYGTKLAGDSTTVSPADVISELVEHLPIFAYQGGRMDPVDAEEVMDWGTAGAGATMLAKRWGSPRLIDLSEDVLRKLLDSSDLLQRLEQMEDFRALREDASKIIAQSQRLKEAKSKAGAGEAGAEEDLEVTAARKAKRDQVQTLRSKLLKFVQRIPVFMYLTDFREQRLPDVITSLDTNLFERVTGLTLGDFHELSRVGVFSAPQMNEAIWQFRLFERASLRYLADDPLTAESAQIGLWDRELTTGSTDAIDRRMELLLAEALLVPGTQLLATDGSGQQATLGAQGEIHLQERTYTTPDAAAEAASGEVGTDGWSYWSLAGLGTLAELADLL